MNRVGVRMCLEGRPRQDVSRDDAIGQIRVGGKARRVESIEAATAAGIMDDDTT